ncbi:two-component response regulator-like aprr5 [Phtheirospermum japonicum]|uniref:Two-component response regulator-like aprr5 n=1 Tax=Phtheirospermum japonicum TaxID=374723 RepID=A0A830BMK0_9LAMI|nr:two-component response regulator-like aprr5 [Phtheirospermum japonicum]
MEHEVCKNIPVIMMSSQDAVSTVYKCMLKGAADFLVKPVRKNELRNLWQHVWRKQASSTAAGLGPPDENVQEKDETTAENNDISNHSSGFLSSIQRNKECTEKGSDAQSSCTKPESESEGKDAENDYYLSQPKSTTCLSGDVNILTQEVNDLETHALVDIDAENTRVFEKSSREAIDLIGNFDNFKGTFGSSDSNVSANKFDVLPFLDLSLRRPNQSGLVNQVNNDERPRLNHSDASAFSRYINKPSPVPKPTSPVTSIQLRDDETNSEKQSSSYAPDNHVSTANTQTGQPEITFPYSHHREISHPIPIRGVRLENTINGYNSVMPSLYRAQSGSSPLSSPHTPHPTESFPQLSPFYPSDHQPSSSQQLCSLDKKIGNSIGQTENKSENLDDRVRISPGDDQSGNSNFCNGNKSHDGVNYAISVTKAPLECGNEESLHVHDGASQRSMLREAALNKFRLKRKDRCFEKKVRYESRKKLAEQRPRVKGQFVRQVPSDTQPGNSSAVG